jgi:hypothetical protein
MGGNAASASAAPRRDFVHVTHRSLRLRSAVSALASAAAGLRGPRPGGRPADPGMQRSPLRRPDAGPGSGEGGADPHPGAGGPAGPHRPPCGSPAVPALRPGARGRMGAGLHRRGRGRSWRHDLVAGAPPCEGAGSGATRTVQARRASPGRCGLGNALGRSSRKDGRSPREGRLPSGHRHGPQPAGDGPPRRAHPGAHPLREGGAEHVRRRSVSVLPSRDTPRYDK